MSAHLAYQQQRQQPLPRIELLLQTYSGMLRLFDEILARLRQKNNSAQPLIFQLQLIVQTLALSIDVNQGELPKNYLRLYEFVQCSLAAGDEENMEAARKVILVLQQGLEEIREEALRLERTGRLPPPGSGDTLETIA